MQNEDCDEDFYEEETSKIIYKKRSSGSRPSLNEFDEEDRGFSKRSNNEKTKVYGREQDISSNRGRYLEKNVKDSSSGIRGVSPGEATTVSHITKVMKMDDADYVYRGGRSDYFEDNATKPQASKSKRFDDVAKPVMRDQLAYDSLSDSCMSTTDRVKQGMKDWSERARQTVQKKPKDFVEKRCETDGESYYAVNKWEVDYTNKNFVRSKCNKPQGLHRYVMGRPFDWEVGYDNRCYLSSKVNAPKGLHRLEKEVKRKRVPDNDILADSTGWEFEYGPEFNQVEGDVPFHRKEKVIGRGGYRFYGVRRNNSDVDIKIKEKPCEIKGLNKEEFKYGTEFQQDDIPHVVKLKEKRIGRGGYRYPHVKRNVCDIHPTDFKDIDYRESRTSIDTSLTDEDHVVKPMGKPFKRTELKKTYTLVKPPSVEKFTHGTHLTFVPGKGSQMLYEGKSTRPSLLEVKKHPSIRSVFKSKSKTYSYERLTPTRLSSFKGSDSDLSARGSWKRDSFVGRDNTSKRPSLNNYSYYAQTDERKPFQNDKKREFIADRPSPRFEMESPIRRRSSPSRQPVNEYCYHAQREERRHAREDGKKEFEAGRSRRRLEKDTYKENGFPSGIQPRIEEIKRKVPRETPSDSKGLDWKRHEDHSCDHGKTVMESYEKYVNENGTETWMTAKNKYSKLHHRKPR